MGSLTINIDPEELERLLENGYNLCLAKKFNNAYTVVFSGEPPSPRAQTITWNETYQVFGASQFLPGALVEAFTSAVHIDLGETATLSQDGILDPAEGDAAGESFYVRNKYAPIVLGVNLQVAGSYVPSFVTTSVAVVGTQEFTPEPKILVWFDRNLRTSAMFSQSVALPYEVDFSERNSAEISWVSQGGNPGWVEKK